MKKLCIVGAGVLGAVAVSAAVAGTVAVRSEWRRWGVAPGEASAPLPGDDLVAEADTADTRGIDIAAPPEHVWPWLVQMGYGRAGWYSYDALDMDRPSAVAIDPALQSLAVGDLLPTDPGGGFEVRVLEPGRALVAYVDRALVEAQRGPRGGEAASESASANVRATGAYLDRAVPGDFAASWAFVLEPRSGGTRLLERFRVRMEPPSRGGRPAAMPSAARSLLGLGVFAMTRRQMLGIRDRAEGRPVRTRRVGMGAFRFGPRRRTPTTV